MMQKNELVKKTVYNKLVAKVNNIDTSGFVLKTKCQTEIRFRKENSTENS